MRKRLWFVLTGLGLAGSGCSLVTDATCLTIFTVRQTTDDFREGIRNRKWAAFAWEDAKRADLHKTYSEDYANGFKDGFAHYLYRGGSGEPPPLPPMHYRRMRYQTPQGYKAIEDWFAGFRHGAAAARQGGYRYWITGPSALGPPVPLAILPAPWADQAGSAPSPPPARELELVSIERPVPLPRAPVTPKMAEQRPSIPRQVAVPSAAMPQKSPAQQASASSPPPPRPQPEQPSASSAPPPRPQPPQASASSTAPPLRPQAQPVSALPGSSPSAPLPQIVIVDPAGAELIKRDPKRLPTIVNGEESAGRSP